METTWISVNEALPETLSMFGGCSMDVFVHYKRKGYMGDIDVYATGCYCGGNRWRAIYQKASGDYGYEGVNVDYWMPIPSIPKGGNNG